MLTNDITNDMFLVLSAYGYPGTLEDAPVEALEEAARFKRAYDQARFRVRKGQAQRFLLATNRAGIAYVLAVWNEYGIPCRLDVREIVENVRHTCLSDIQDRFFWRFSFQLMMVVCVLLFSLLALVDTDTIFVRWEAFTNTVFFALFGITVAGFLIVLLTMICKLQAHLLMPRWWQEDPVAQALDALTAQE